MTGLGELGQAGGVEEKEGAVAAHPVPQAAEVNGEVEAKSRVSATVHVVPATSRGEECTGGAMDSRDLPQPPKSAPKRPTSTAKSSRGGKPKGAAMTRATTTEPSSNQADLGHGSERLVKKPVAPASSKQKSKSSRAKVGIGI